MLNNFIEVEKELPADLIQRIDNNWKSWLAKYFPEYKSRLYFLTDIYEDLTAVSEDDALKHLEEILAREEYSTLFCLYYNFSFSQFNLKQKSFFNAVIEGNMVTVAEMLKEDASLVHLNDADERYPLHHAAYRGYTEICDLLLASGASLNVTNYKKDTALHEAVDNGHYATCELLLNRGANFNADQEKSQGEFTGGNTPLHVAAQEGYLDICQLLIAKGADVNMLNSDDKTPFTIAAENSYWNVCEFFLKPMGLSKYCVMGAHYQAIEAERSNIQKQLKDIQTKRARYKHVFFKRNEEKRLAFNQHQKTISRFYKLKSRPNKNTRLKV